MRTITTCMILLFMLQATAQHPFLETSTYDNNTYALSDHSIDVQLHMQAKSPVIMEDATMPRAILPLRTISLKPLDKERKEHPDAKHSTDILYTVHPANIAPNEQRYVMQSFWEANRTLPHLIESWNTNTFSNYY